MTWDHQQVVRHIAQACLSQGFDLVQGAPLSAYNTRVEPQWRLPAAKCTHHPDDADQLMVIVGNTRAMWPKFQAARAVGGDHPENHPENHPLDTWTMATLDPIFASAAALGLERHHTVRYAFEPPPRRIAMQRLAHHAGFAHLGPAHLLVHPRFGPWIALRAAAVFPVPPPPPPSPAPDPCSGCPGQPCLPALDTAVAKGTSARWQDWLALRDACPEGAEHRYTDEQCHYHYAKAPFAVGG